MKRYYILALFSYKYRLVGLIQPIFRLVLNLKDISVLIIY